MKQLIYIASPYSSPSDAVRQYRYDKVVKYVTKMMLTGCNVFSPVIHSHPMNTSLYRSTGDWRYWKRYSLFMLSKCDGMLVLMLDGWLDSVGVTAEIDEAKKLGLPINYGIML
jgi:hypothetical protein